MYPGYLFGSLNGSSTFSYACDVVSHDIGKMSNYGPGVQELIFRGVLSLDASRHARHEVTILFISQNANWRLTAKCIPPCTRAMMLPKATWATKKNLRLTDYCCFNIRPRPRRRRKGRRSWKGFLLSCHALDKFLDLEGHRRKRPRSDNPLWRSSLLPLRPCLAVVNQALLCQPVTFLEHPVTLDKAPHGTPPTPSPHQMRNFVCASFTQASCWKDEGHSKSHFCLHCPVWVGSQKSKPPINH